MTDTIEDIRHTAETIAARLAHGCRNHGCLIEAPRGMATNGGCRCQPNRIAKELFDLACRVEKMGYRWVKAPGCTHEVLTRTDGDTCKEANEQNGCWMGSGCDTCHGTGIVGKHRCGTCGQILNAEEKP